MSSRPWLTEEQKRDIRNAYALGKASMAALAAERGCSLKAVWSAVHSGDGPAVGGHDTIQDRCGKGDPALTEMVRNDRGRDHKQDAQERGENFNPYIGWWYPWPHYRPKAYMVKPERDYGRD